jgi:hypothetical protein
MTISLHLPDIASMRSISFAAVAAAAAIGTLLVAGCSPSHGGATAAAGGGAQDAGWKLFTRGRQMLAYTASQWLAGPYSSIV